MHIRPLFLSKNNEGMVDIGSIKANVSESAQENENRILDYISKGKPFVGCAGFIRDKVGNNRKIAGSLNILTDGVWAWSECLVYFIEEYHIKLPNDFISHAEMNNWQIHDDIDVTNLEIQF